MSTDSPPGSNRVKYFEPTLHFTSTRMQIGEDDTGDRIVVSELVHKDSLLLSFEDFAKFQDRGFEKQPVKAGDHTYFSEGNNELYAAVPGYPRVDRFVAEDENKVETLVVSVEPLFRVTSDKMKATLAVHPPLPEGRSLIGEDLDQLLAEAGIVHGLDVEKVATAKEYVQQGLKEFHSIVVATGHECGPSQDAFLQFLIEIGPIAGKLLKDGSIDFRERRVMVPVSEGEVLAMKIPASPGTAGVNVFGENIEAQAGKDILVKTSGDVSFNPETNEVRATAGGVLSVVRGNIINVSSRKKIEGDIDFSTGNVESKNCLVIKGSVQPGFMVKADGDVEISGTVSSATVESLANIVIKSGITGQKTRIAADGDVDILFIEQGRIDCGGNCVVRKQAYYSTIHAGGDIRCRKESTVVGSEMVAAGSMTFGDVGSEKANPLLLAAGVTPERLEKYREMKKNLSEMQAEIIQQLQIGGGRSRKLRQMEREAEVIKLQLKRMNMVPGSGLYSRAGAAEEGNFTAEEMSDKYSINLREISIEVQGSIQAGTTIQIGNRTMLLDKTISYRLFKLSDNLKRILAVPPPRRRR
ncbi:DUF342 domain-containing protein [Desulfopila aestuarii]|uniref:Flagellar Assembly Protein A N-terminal region domain-containing protein n=1 Tax=Desulfopila aestuarii DSM 18488 TaxID=1121416 RepID=A0A1M7Y8Z9_9BACT|nr:FapA family protein [Desulfopila aestuarii]SHO49115.1 hypothetical protein SAMN02745220_02704 [Desulfopila aestuarii DSM 18488]